MSGFISFTSLMRKLLLTIITSKETHAKWLNTLSFLENCGARKIAACEHPTLVKEEMLKHAAEEFRHAHYLKRQIEKISPISIENYSASSILGGNATFHYLTALDLKASRYLNQAGFAKESIKEIAYLLVTYAIELRAEELYPLYEQLLRQKGFPIFVKSILLEEQEHLAEMKEGICHLPSGFLHAKKICIIESKLCEKWLDAIGKELESG